MLASVIPIIFIQWNKSECLEDVVWQAKQYNARVIVLSDESNLNCRLNNDIEYYNIADYEESANEFEKIYKHISGVPYAFEIACYKRWFVINEFMEKNKIEIAMHADSDQMIYCDISLEYKKNYKQFDVSTINFGPVYRRREQTCADWRGGNISYWNKKGINCFCQYMSDCYSDPSYIQFYLNDFDPNSCSTWIHDDGPTLPVFALKYKDRLKFGDINIITDEGFFDGHVCLDFDWDGRRLTSQYETTQKNIYHDYIAIIKRIVWIDNKPYCYHKGLSKHIKLKSIHLQGCTKKLSKELKHANPDKAR